MDCTGRASQKRAYKLDGSFLSRIFACYENTVSVSKKEYLKEED